MRRSRQPAPFPPTGRPQSLCRWPVGLWCQWLLPLSLLLLLVSKQDTARANGSRIPIPTGLSLREDLPCLYKVPQSPLHVHFCSLGHRENVGPYFGSRREVREAAAVVYAPGCSILAHKHVPSFASPLRSRRAVVFAIYRSLWSHSRRRSGAGAPSPPYRALHRPRVLLDFVFGIGEFAFVVSPSQCLPFALGCRESLFLLTPMTFRTPAMARHRGERRRPPPNAQIEPQPSISRSTAQNRRYRFGASFC